MRKQKPRVNKSKKQIVSELQLVDAANRRRSLIKDIIFPYLVKIDDNIEYSKVFLQVFSSMVTGATEEMEKKIVIEDLMPQIKAKLDNAFKTSDPEQEKEYKRYLGLFELLKEISVQDLLYAVELPRYIDGYLLHEHGKEPINNIPIDKILG